MSEAFVLQPLSDRDFTKFRTLAYDYCGLNIEAGKETLVASRLGKIMRELSIGSFSEYYDFVVGDKSSKALVHMIDHLTTNHTSFFREPQHFQFLTTQILPALAERREIQIWSAACSSGEEPYSIVFTASEVLAPRNVKLSVLATDISTRILETAQRGIYDANRLRDMPDDMKRKYLLKGNAASVGRFCVKPSVRAMVRFERVNLMEPLPEFVGQYPLILCRNAMIYFDAPTQERLVQRFFQHLEPGGYLFIGHSESLNSIRHDFEYVCPATYRKPGRLK